MENITLHAHFDGTRIQLDDPFELKPNTKLLVTVIHLPETTNDSWVNLSLQGLDAAYNDDEPEYSLTLIKEQNPAYERS
jgi:hypothetical protein